MCIRDRVVHGHFTVNGHRVDIPSYLVKEGDVIELRTRDCEKIKGSVEKNAGRPTPVWMTADRENFKTTINRLPDRADIDFDVEEHLIVELYSK